MVNHKLKNGIAVIFYFSIFLFKTNLVLSAICAPSGSYASLQSPPDSLNTTQQSSIPIASITIREEIYLLGCKNTGFSGYFGIENWDIRNQGDGGVDVTGAPNGLLINIISKSPNKENPRDEWRCKIAIPSEGYVHLDLEKIGGSIFSMEYMINGGKSFPLYRSDKKVTSQFTNLLHRNDLLEVIVIFDSSENNTFLLKDFNFFTNTEKIRQKTYLQYSFWAGSPMFHCKKSFIPTPVFGIENIFIPSSITTNSNQTSPRHTGYPIIDIDGTLFTSMDQFKLDNRIAPFKLKWEDKLIITGHRSKILRKWTIVDQCQENILTNTQTISFKNSSETNK